MNVRKQLIQIGMFAFAITLVASQPSMAQVKQDVKEAAAKTGNAITDGWITMKIHAQFVPEKALDNSDINVDTNKGIVVLKGTVASAEGRSRAVAIAKASDGVKGVVDNLTIAAPAPGTMSDGWIKSKIYGQFVTEKTLDGSDINIDVTKGVVTLKGTVRSRAARTRATAIAKTTHGVKSVKDMLMISTRRAS